MTLEDLGNIGEFVGAIGVIVSLAYLAIQIRQNTKSVRAATFQEAARDLAESADLLTRDPELTRIYFAAARDFESMPRGERQRFATYMHAYMRRAESLVYQAEQGTLDPASWEGQREFLRYMFSQPGVVAWWGGARNLFNSSLQRLVENEFL